MNDDRDKLPSVYEGKTFCSGYTRMKNHWTKYNSKTGQGQSFMFHHTTSSHNGQIGPEKGKEDYRVKITGQFRSNLERQTEEGVRQTTMERLQFRDKVTVLNSKLDFCQPFRSTLAVLSNAVNLTPGTNINNIISKVSNNDNNPNNKDITNLTSTVQVPPQRDRPPQPQTETNTNRRRLQARRRIQTPGKDFSPTTTSTPQKPANSSRIYRPERKRVRFDAELSPTRPDRA